MNAKICGMDNCKHMQLRRNPKTQRSDLHCDRYDAWLRTRKNPKPAEYDATDLALRCDACLLDDGYEPEGKR